MHAPYRSPSTRCRSIYAPSIPVAQAEALHRRQALDAQQRAYRHAPSDGVPHLPHGPAFGGGRPPGWVHSS
jgi:hypothetical protein